MPRNEIFFEGTKWYLEIRKSKTWEWNMFSKNEIFFQWNLKSSMYGD